MSKHDIVIEVRNAFERLGYFTSLHEGKSFPEGMPDILVSGLGINFWITVLSGCGVAEHRAISVPWRANQQQWANAHYGSGFIPVFTVIGDVESEVVKYIIVPQNELFDCQLVSMNNYQAVKNAQDMVLSIMMTVCFFQLKSVERNSEQWAEAYDVKRLGWANANYEKTGQGGVVEFGVENRGLLQKQDRSALIDAVMHTEEYSDKFQEECKKLGRELSKEEAVELAEKYLSDFEERSSAVYNEVKSI